MIFMKINVKHDNMLQTVPGSSMLGLVNTYILSNIILPAVQEDRYIYSYFKDEKSEAQLRQVKRLAQDYSLFN